MTPLAPIQHHIDALADGPGYPAEAVEGCLRQAEQATPILRALLQRAARGLALSDAEASQLFLGVHILAQLRDKSSFPTLLRLLCRPYDELEALLGDAVTTTMPSVAAGLFDGDADSLFDTITDTGVDPFVRDALWRAATFLTHQGRIGREALAAFIVRFDDERLAPSDDMAWYGWLQAIALLGLEDLAPRVEPLWSDDRLPKDIPRPQAFPRGSCGRLEGPGRPRPLQGGWGGTARRRRDRPRLGSTGRAAGALRQPDAQRRPATILPLRQRQEGQEVLPRRRLSRSLRVGSGAGNRDRKARCPGSRPPPAPAPPGSARCARPDRPPSGRGSSPACP